MQGSMSRPSAECLISRNVFFFESLDGLLEGHLGAAEHDHGGPLRPAGAEAVEVRLGDGNRFFGSTVLSSTCMGSWSRDTISPRT